MTKFIRFRPVGLMASAAIACQAWTVQAQNITIASGESVNQQQSVAGTDHLTIEQGATLLVDDDAIQWNAPATDLRIDNAGVIESTAESGRAIDAGGDATGPRTFTLTNASGARIAAPSDAIRIDVDITDGAVVINNAGAIRSTGDGQAIDFNSLSSTSAGQITVNNAAGGVIQSLKSDAVRPGADAIVNNAGVIDAGDLGGNTGSDGIDFQDRGGTVNNLGGATISGARHGITGDGDLFVTNAADGTIIGRNGSGVNADGAATVVNRGLISGNYNGLSADRDGDGDGDGIDIDGVGRVENYGRIEANGYAGVHNDLVRANGSDGLTLGAGTLTNYTGATITSVLYGVATERQSAITNEGTIHGDLIAVFQQSNNNLLENSGTISGADGVLTGAGDDRVINAGTIIGSNHAVQLGNGNDTLVVRNGSRIVGAVDGGAGANTLAIEDGGVFDHGDHFQRLLISGNAVVIGDNNVARTTIASGASLQLGQGRAAGAVGGSIQNGGMLLVNHSDDFTVQAVRGSGGVAQIGSGTTVIGNDNSYTGPTLVTAGTLVSHGTLNSAVVVRGGVFDGAGSVSGLTVGGSGTARVDSKVGQLRVSGDLSLAKGAVLVLPDATTGNRLSVDGQADVDGAQLDLSATGPLEPFQAYPVLTAAGGVSGTFAPIDLQSSYIFLAPILEYDRDGVDLALRRNVTPFASVAATANQTAVANGLDALPATGAAS